MEVNNDLMEKYICQLIEDLDEIVKNPPQGAYIEAPPHLVGLPDIAELALTPYKTIEEITGISIDSFPKSYKLDGLQIQRVNTAIFRVFEALNITLIDAPEDIPPELMYDVLTMNWDFHVQHLPTAGMDLEFCTGNPQDCPYGFYCSCSRDSGEFELPEKYETLIPEIAKKLNNGMVCYFDTTSLEIETVQESMVINPVDDENNNENLFNDFDLFENLWECKIIFFPLGSQQIYDIMTNFAILQNDEFNEKLNRALNGKKIFGEFYSVVKSSGYQNEWNKFIHDQTEEHVRKMLTDKLYDPFSGNHEEINGLYNDDGTKIDSDSIPVPEKCLTCRSYYSDDWEDDILCKLTRNDQRDSDKFQCEAYTSI